MTAPTLAVVVVAAGSGTRLGAGAPKAFVEIAGRPVLERALKGVLAMSEPAQVVLVVPSSHRADAQAIVARTAGVVADHVDVVVGAESRQGSVAAGLAVLRPEIDTVLVHDAARVLTPAEQFARVAHAVRATGGGVIPSLRVPDTIKSVDGATITGTVDRDGLVRVQTPQGFPRAALDAAYAAAVEEHTDDAALFAQSGHPVLAVEGDELAFKITTPWDLRRAESLIGSDTAVRTGVGVDVHAFDEAAPLWLGGLYWPDEPGLSGHSDGDALSHAVCDALLSAAGLGDIGGRFGTSDPRLAGAHGEVFLRETAALVSGAGFRIGSVAVQVVANRPKIGRRRTEMEAFLSQLLGAPVSVSATTSDALGFTGRGEGVWVIATALVHPAR